MILCKSGSKQIQNQDRKFLIVRKRQRWQAVDGRLDKGEKLEEGWLRETIIKELEQSEADGLAQQEEKTNYN